VLELAKLESLWLLSIAPTIELPKPKGQAKVKLGNSSPSNRLLINPALLGKFVLLGSRTLL
jgi:hypothetical protein